MCMTDGGETRCYAQLNSGRKIDGTFAEYTVVPYRYITTLPEGPKDEVLAPILCGGVTIYKGLKICGATAGQWIVISGAGGGVGALGVQYAKAMGFRTVAIDAGKDKQNYCLDLGAEMYIDVLTTEDASAVVKEKTGGGAAAVLVAAGSGKAYNAAPTMLGPFGTLVCIGITPPDQLLSVHPLLLIDMGIRVIASAVGTRKDIREAIEFVERGLVKPTIHLGKLEELSDIGAQMMQGKVRNGRDTFRELLLTAVGNWEVCHSTWR